MYVRFVRGVTGDTAFKHVMEGNTDCSCHVSIVITLFRLIWQAEFRLVSNQSEKCNYDPYLTKYLNKKQKSIYICVIFVRLFPRFFAAMYICIYILQSRLLIFSNDYSISKLMFCCHITQV